MKEFRQIVPCLSAIIAFTQHGVTSVPIGGRHSLRHVSSKATKKAGYRYNRTANIQFLYAFFVLGKAILSKKPVSCWRTIPSFSFSNTTFFTKSANIAFGFAVLNLRRSVLPSAYRYWPSSLNISDIRLHFVP